MRKEKGKQKKSESLDRLVFGRRNSERAGDVVPREGQNNRKWPNLPLRGRDRKRVERQIEFGRSFYRPEDLIARRFQLVANAKCSRVAFGQNYT